MQAECALQHLLPIPFVMYISPPLHLTKYKCFLARRQVEMGRSLTKSSA